MGKDTIGILVHATGSTGVLHQLTGVIARHQGDIASVEILDNRATEARTSFEVVLPGGPEALMDDLRALPIVRRGDRQDAAGDLRLRRLRGQFTASPRRTC